MDWLSQTDTVTLPSDDEILVLEFEYIFNDELEAMARDKDLDELHRLWERESVDNL